MEGLPIPESVDATVRLLDAGGYVADRRLATTLFLSLELRRPLFLEGEAGVGKTEIAKVLAEQLGRRLIRLQCHDGLDAAAAVYEWDYARQMITIRMAEAAGRTDRDELGRDVFSPEHLIRRPLLEALDEHPGGAPVLLIDEVDRADEPFEAYLLELLSDFQVTIPELGTFRAREHPLAVLTSNRTREVHDALKRRCFYHWIDYPDVERERAILRRRAPDAPADLTEQVVRFVQRLRDGELFKPPGVAESIDWTRALVALDRVRLDPETVDGTLGVLLKYQDDVDATRGAVAARLVEEVRSEPAG